MVDFRVGQLVGYSFGISDNDEYDCAPKRGSIGKVIRHDCAGAWVKWNNPIPKRQDTNTAYYLGSRLHHVAGGF